MKNTESLNLMGELSIYKKYRDGTSVLFFKEDNLIVNAAKQFLLTGIYAANIVSDPIVSLKAGTGGNIDPEGLYPKAESPTQTDLITPAITVSTIYVVDLANISVTFLADMDQTQCNGLQLTEAGLFKASGLIFNVKNHPGISKTSDFSVHYSWAVKYL